MIDFTKLISENQEIINRLYHLSEKQFQPHKPQNNNYTCFSNGSGRFRLEFRKVQLKGRVIGFRHVEVCFSPHYIFNDDLHNGNDFSPLDCIKTINEVYLMLQISNEELEEFRVTGIEFGVNIQTAVKIEDLVAGFTYFKMRRFKVPDLINPHSKISDTTNYKLFKVYGKGLQFSDFPEYGIDLRTVRLEIKSKQAKNILRYGIRGAKDLLNIEIYGTLSDELLKELDFVFIANLFPDFSKLNGEEVRFIQNANKSDFIKGMCRVEFARFKKKYYKTLGSKNNLHLQIKMKIIDKLYSFQTVTFSTEKTVINKIVFERGINQLSMIKVENATTNPTSLEILVQEHDHYLPLVAMKNSLQTHLQKYADIENKYQNDLLGHRPFKEQTSYIASDIGNLANHTVDNFRRFKERNYTTNQIQSNF